ncbi:MAG: SRPBCC family protein [Kangiellaceae bacterium]|jgi:hypothetical protein|nr:SRPBCC family protein [Kangiellaceae bacterium]
MKILLRIAQVITAIILVFFSIGLFVNEFSYQTETVVDASPEQSFQVFSDPTLTSQWLTGFIKFEPIKGQPYTVDSQWKLFIESNGEVMEMTETVTAIILNKQFSFILDNDVMLVDVDITFTAQGGQTLIVSNNKVNGKGLFWKSMLFLSKPFITAQNNVAYQKLAKLIEKSK